MKRILVIGLVCAACGIAACNKTEMVTESSEEQPLDMPVASAAEPQITELPDTSSSEPTGLQPLQIHVDHSAIPVAAPAPSYAPPPPAAKAAGKSGGHKKRKGK
jgi:hypothetical protein